MKGFIDESGTEEDSAYLAISLIIFDDDAKITQARASLSQVRSSLELPSSYEFHRAHNPPKIRSALERTLNDADFLFYTFAIEKQRRATSLNYERLAEHLVREIHPLGPIQIVIDSNPTLKKKLGRAIKNRNLHNIKVREGESKRYDGLQIADYVVNISRHKIDQTAGKYKYQKLFKKCLGYHII